ncbi:MAG: LysR family transcriptional regulator [Acidobacteriota bacterium]
MEEFDYLELDGRQLQILLTIEQAGSLSAAGKILDLSQSTVSYWLDLLRKRLGDPLFVRAGNGVEPTERAKALLPRAREALLQLQSICQPEEYTPAEDTGRLRIAISSVERDLLIAPLVRKVLELAPRLTLEILRSGSASGAAETLRQGQVDFTILPERWLEGEGFRQRRLLDFEDAVFFDPAFPLAEGDVDGFCARPQVRVALGEEAGFNVEGPLAKLRKSRHVALQVADFNSALELLRGTPLVATLPSLLAKHCGKGLGCIAPPWPDPKRGLMLYWHSRHEHSARHDYWREQVSALATRASG